MKNTDNVEAFLFELNELLRNHKATIETHGPGLVRVIANGQTAVVGQVWDNNTHDVVPHRLAIRQK